jgi:hypothetical protein
MNIDKQVMHPTSDLDDARKALDSAIEVGRRQGLEAAAKKVESTKHYAFTQDKCQSDLAASIRALIVELPVLPEQPTEGEGIRFEKWFAETYPAIYSLTGIRDEFAQNVRIGWLCRSYVGACDGHDYQRKNPTAYVHESVPRKIIGERDELRNQLEAIATAKNGTATDAQFARHLQWMAADATGLPRTAVHLASSQPEQKGQTFNPEDILQDLFNTGLSVQRLTVNDLYLDSGKPERAVASRECKSVPDVDRDGFEGWASTMWFGSNGDYFETLGYSDSIKAAAWCAWRAAIQSGISSNKGQPNEQNAVSAALPAQEGWKLVPIEPTDEMQEAGAHAIRFDTTAINKIWTGNRVYRSMLAAVPQPEQGEQP